MPMNSLQELFISYTGLEPTVCRPLSPSGSRRRYCRMAAGETALIGVAGTDADEDRAFIALSGHLRSKGINVPRVLAVSEDAMYYLQEDLGDCVLYESLASARRDGIYTPEQEALLCGVIKQLPRIQFEGAEGLDFSVCYPDSGFNGRMVDFDLNYFKYCFLKTSSVEFNELLLQEDFDRLKTDLLAESSDSFMYRDFQARNVMLKDGAPWFIDFQGGRRGPFYYDLASFVWQAKAAYPQKLKQKLTDVYYASLCRYHSVEREHFDRRLRLFVLFRTLQVLGAYGFRGRVERKPHFLESIPYALANLRELLSEAFTEYPYLSRVLDALSRGRGLENPPQPPHLSESLSRLQPEAPGASQPPSGDGILEVEVLSFSFKRGLPQDDSGHGGGYIFDCRSVHNPGRYAQYRQLTGRDRAVRSFLEDDGEIITFLDHAQTLVDAHVARFIERGFTHLQVAFGCTGGRHRSVYCAGRMAEQLSAVPGVRVHLIHRELGIDIPGFTGPDITDCPQEARQRGIPGPGIQRPDSF